MSRWSRRSSEEKHRILKEQGQMKVGKKKTSTRLIGGDKDTALAIYITRQIPIICPKCGDWRESEKYTIKYGTGMFEGLNLIHGRCKDCGGGMFRTIPSAFGYEGIMFTEALLTLMKDERIRDLTKGR